METQFVETLSRSASTLHIIPQLLAVVKTFSKPPDQPVFSRPFTKLGTVTSKTSLVKDVERSYFCLYILFVLNLGISNEVLEGALIHEKNGGLLCAFAANWGVPGCGH